jgi:hypothetical protein
VDPVDGVIRRYSIIDFLEEFPPQILFPDGTSIVDGLGSKPVTMPDLNPTVLQPQRWEGCDIHSETTDTAFGMSVQRYIQEEYIPTLGKGIIVINDHQSYEIADTITIDVIGRRISLIHIKAAKIRKGIREKPGRRQADLQVVLSQAITSSIWIRNVRLASELNRRLNEREATELIRGRQVEVEEFERAYSPALYNFEIVVVQPALLGNGLRDPLKDMIASTQDYILAAGAIFTLLCSE